MRQGMRWKFIIPLTGIIVIMMVVSLVFMVGYVQRQNRIIADAEESAKVGDIIKQLELIDMMMTERVKLSMKLLKEKGMALGEAKLGKTTKAGKEEVPDLVLGKVTQANNFKLVDEVKSIMGGTATLFVRRGEDFIRVSTNVIKDDGSRAIGTPLDPKGKAIKAIRQGKPFYGLVDILGKPYLTGYEPIYNTNKQIIGVWYVGYPVTALKQLEDMIEKTQILKSGFIALLDEQENILFKPERVKTDLLRGILTSDSALSTEWSASKTQFAPWGYQIIAAHPVEDMKRDSRHAAFVIIVIAVVLMIVVIVVINVLIRYTVIRPMNNLLGLSTKLAQNDLTTRIDIATKDELGEMAKNINTMAENLRHIIHAMSSNAGVLAESASSVSAAADQIAKGSEDQVRQIAQSATATTEVAQSITDVAKNAIDAAEAARRSVKVADDGKKVVENTVNGMLMIAATVGESAKTIEELGRNSSQIGDIINVIHDIADQTNLLALNAAIEAARAGEQGRGFAVVANEVRKLAERTSKATGEIAAMIKNIQQNTEMSVNAMNEGQKKVEEGVTLAQGAHKALDDIVKASDTCLNMIQMIATATEQQSSAVEEVSASMESLANISKMTQTSINAVTYTISDLSRLTAELNKMTAQFKFTK